MRQSLDENTVGRSRIRLSEIVASLSFALDITEGQPVGHAARTCLIGMRIGEQLGLATQEQSSLFYGLLLKDLGCSSNSAKVCSLFGSDDRDVKGNLKIINWSRLLSSVGYICKNVSSGGTLLQKACRFAAVAKQGTGAAREMVQIRCERGANIARDLQLPETTAEAI